MYEAVMARSRAREYSDFMASTNASVEWPRGTTVTRVKPDVQVTLYATDCGNNSTSCAFTILDSAGHVVFGPVEAPVALFTKTSRYDGVLTPHIQGIYTLKVQPNSGAIGYTTFEVNSGATSPGEGADMKKLMTYAAVGVGILAAVYLGGSYLMNRKK